MTANLRRLQRALGDQVGKDVFMYSLTLRPETDTPEVLKRYAESFGIAPGWQLLTGKPEDIGILRYRLGFVDSDPELDADASQHIGMVVFGNDRLNRWSACPALLDISELKRLLSSIGLTTA
jgi:protein SCO1/2